jgi:alpha-galactosidase
MWRTTGDIGDSWSSIAEIGFSQAGLENYARPGYWNDPDMLVVGMVGWGKDPRPSKLRPNEQILHITLWSLLSAPLMLGCDLSQMDDFTLALLTNDEVLEVNQDPLGKQAGRAAVQGECEVWARPLRDGTLAVGPVQPGPVRGPCRGPLERPGRLGPPTGQGLVAEKGFGDLKERLLRLAPAAWGPVD